VLVVTEDLVQLIHDGAVLERHGAFTLAVEKAQEKLKKFQLPDPRYYITQVFQALLAGGADRIEVFTDELRVSVVFNGPGFTRYELEHIGDAVFESGKNRERDRLRELALGLLSLQGLNPQKIEIVSNDVAWTRVQGGRASVAPAGGRAQSLEIQHRRSDTNEATILRHALHGAQADIWINRQVAGTKGAQLSSCPWPNYGFRGDGFQGAFGIAYGDIQVSSVLLTRYGVAFSRRSEPRIQPPLVVEMEHLGLRKNASQSDVVEDEHYTSMLGQVQRIQLEFSLQLAQKRLPSYQADQVFNYLREVALQHLSTELLRLPLEELGPLDRKLVEAPLLPGVNGRRYSAREVFQADNEHGGLLFCEEQRLNLDCPPASILRLTPASAQALLYLFPRLQHLPKLSAEAAQRALLKLRRAAEISLPKALIRRSLELSGRTVELVLLREPATANELLVYERELTGGVVQVRSLGYTPLSFALITEGQIRFSREVPPEFIEVHVAPLYEQLIRSLGSGGAKVPLLPAQQAALEYITWKAGPAGIGRSGWSHVPIFHSVQGKPISVDDMRAWLKVYPALVATYGPAVNADDHAVQLTPPGLAALRAVLGADNVLLAHLAEPRLVERSQQAGLSFASKQGVQKLEVFDEDAELAAIRQEIEEAQKGGLQVREEQPLDEALVLSQLGLGKRPAPAAPEPQDELDPFVRQCLSATKQLGTPWLTRFEAPGVEGQLVVFDGPVPRPLQPDHLVVKVAGNEPTSYPTNLGLCGWLYIPAGWEQPNRPFHGVVRPDSSPAHATDAWPWPEVPFELGIGVLNQDYVWAVRRLFKLAAQHCSQVEAGSQVHSLWHRRIVEFFRWDEAWANSSPNSWFLSVPLVRTLLGEWKSLLALIVSPDQLFWAPLVPGNTPHAAHTVRIVPPLEATELARWLGRPLLEAELHIEEKREEQLLAEVKQRLVETCQKAECPLEPSWIENLNFGPPTRWIGGPRRYFIEHKAAEGVTQLNPADKLFHRLFQDQKEWQERVPLLASAVYTAINRALEDVDDSHELAYLEAMLQQL
jgi:hypothetical protein